MNASSILPVGPVRWRGSPHNESAARPRHRHRPESRNDRRGAVSSGARRNPSNGSREALAIPLPDTRLRRRSAMSARVAVLSRQALALGKCAGIDHGGRLALSVSGLVSITALSAKRLPDSLAKTALLASALRGMRRKSRSSSALCRGRFFRSERGPPPGWKCICRGRTASPSNTSPARRFPASIAALGPDARTSGQASRGRCSALTMATE